MTTGQSDDAVAQLFGDLAPESKSLPIDSRFHAEISPLLADTILAMVRAGKALRVYDVNNQMLVQQLERAYSMLDRVLQFLPEFTLVVREDRLRYERDDVHVDADREAGLPFVFYRNAFRRLTFVRGFSIQELRNLLEAANSDQSSLSMAGEDLVTALWRLSLPHLRYLTIDTLSAPVETRTEAGRKKAEEVGRLQGEVDQLVAKIYREHNADVADDDMVKGASITREDLEALKDIKEETKEDLEQLDVATERRIVPVGPQDINQFHGEIVASEGQDLEFALVSVLLELLYGSRTSTDAIGVLELLDKLFETMLVGSRFDRATQLVSTLRERAESPVLDLKVLHISKLLMGFLAKPVRLAPAIEALNDSKRERGTQEVFEFIRALGSSAVPTLLSTLDDIEAPPNRKVICDLMLELGLPSGAALLDRAQRAKDATCRDILSLATNLPLNERAPLALFAARDASPRIRIAGIAMLRPYPKGLADELIAEALLDPEFEIRLAAYRLAGGRQSEPARAVIEKRFRDEDFWDLDTRELRGLTMAYAMIGGPSAIATLDQILSPTSGVFGRSRMTEGQAAAALALGHIGTDEALEAIKRGARTVNAKLRDTCKRAFDLAVAARTKKPAPETDAEIYAIPSGPDILRAVDSGELSAAAAVAPTMRPLRRPVGVFHRVLKVQADAEVMPQHMMRVNVDTLEVPSDAPAVAELPHGSLSAAPETADLSLRSPRECDAVDDVEVDVSMSDPPPPAATGSLPSLDALDAIALPGMAYAPSAVEEPATWTNEATVVDPSASPASQAPEPTATSVEPSAEPAAQTWPDPSETAAPPWTRPEPAPASPRWPSAPGRAASAAWTPEAPTGAWTPGPAPAWPQPAAPAWPQPPTARPPAQPGWPAPQPLPQASWPREPSANPGWQAAPNPAWPQAPNPAWPQPASNPGWDPTQSPGRAQPAPGWDPTQSPGRAQPAPGWDPTHNPGWAQPAPSPPWDPTQGPGWAPPPAQPAWAQPAGPWTPPGAWPVDPRTGTQPAPQTPAWPPQGEPAPAPAKPWPQPPFPNSPKKPDKK
ncbi:MAG: hypothetical protein HYV07_24165 [Deltaproteobacteria bacterium]|nr:hypothetical protein [Deltaproteobacteria bacterium]